MTPHVYKPRRRLRNELLPLVAVGALIFSLVSIFPMKALQQASFKSAAATFPASCAFITLTSEEESAALASTRSAWAVNAKGTRDLRLEMFAAPLLNEESQELLDQVDVPSSQGKSVADYKPTLVPPTLAAPAPVTLVPAVEDAKEAPTFSREDLLKLNSFSNSIKD